MPKISKVIVALVLAGVAVAAAPALGNVGQSSVGSPGAVVFIGGDSDPIETGYIGGGAPEADDTGYIGGGHASDADDTGYIGGGRVASDDTGYIGGGRSSVDGIDTGYIGGGSPL